MYVTHFNRGRIISLKKLDTRRRRRSALLAVAGVYKMKQIPQEKLRGKSKSILKAEKYLPDQVWNNAIDFTLTSLLTCKVNVQEEKKPGTDARQLGFEALGFEDWRRRRDGLGVAVVASCNCKWVFAIVGYVGVIVVVCCNTHRRQAA